MMNLGKRKTFANPSALQEGRYKAFVPNTITNVVMEE